jgi:hypothetical protein
LYIQIEPHTLQRANERGATEQEIIDTINNGVNIPAKAGRMAKAKIILFNNIWNRKSYQHKKIEVYFIIEKEVIITVGCISNFRRFVETRTGAAAVGRVLTTHIKAKI